MASSVQPLALNYSATASRSQATDLVDLDDLNAALSSITSKLNEIIAALDVTTGADDMLADNVVDRSNLNAEVYAKMASLAQEAVADADDA